MLALLQLVVDGPIDRVFGDGFEYPIFFILFYSLFGAVLMVFMLLNSYSGFNDGGVLGLGF